MSNRGRRPAINEKQAEIIRLRDEGRLSWRKIETRLCLGKGHAPTLYRRGKRVLAAREAEQREWEKAEATRFTEAQWWRLSKANRKRWASRAPFSPETMRALHKPKRSRDDRAWNRPENPLAQPMRSESSAPSAMAPTASQRVPEPTQPVSVTPAPVAAPAVPKPSPAPVSAKSKRIFVFNWTPADGCGVHDAEGNPITDSSPFTLLTVHPVERGFEIRFEGRPETLCQADGRRVILSFDEMLHTVKGAAEPEWRVPSERELFVWNSGRGQTPVYRRADGSVFTDFVEGDGPRKGRLFRVTSDDPLALEKDKSLQRDVDEFLVYRVYRAYGIFTASRDGKSFEMELERPCKATGLDWESDFDFQIRADRARTQQQYWLPVARIAPQRDPAKFLPSPWRADPNARDLLIAQRAAHANSRSLEIKQRDAERDEQRKAEREAKTPDLSDPRVIEDIYWRGVGF